MNFETILFFLIALSAIGSALMMITRPNPVKGVLFLIVNFFCLAVLYLMLQAQFIAVIQILVYAGAIMVLFLFVIMLLNLEDEKMLQERNNMKRYVAFAFAGGVLVEIISGIVLSTTGGGARISPEMARLGTVESIGSALFRDFLVPFEVTSLLLLAALVGVIVLAKKKFQS
ncbi:MAG TPA: NADH-quinone oxidoreductase subunit J [Bacteroidota bacterium]|jgi:NADH-quinone oxidoreductase subunit J|nr:NADH-quinone oxidoreductase subunit J [Bacteroidota bacterium]